MTVVRDPADRDRLKAVAEDLAERTLRDLPRGKLPHLNRLVAPRRPAKPYGLRVSRSPVACAAPNESYSADMDQYLADRFPQALSVSSNMITAGTRTKRSSFICTIIPLSKLTICIAAMASAIFILSRPAAANCIVTCISR